MCLFVCLFFIFQGNIICVHGYVCVCVCVVSVQHEVQSNSRTIQTLLTRYRSFYSASSTTQAYLQEVLSYHGDKVTLEAQKVQEFVNECLQNSKSDLDQGVCVCVCLFTMDTYKVSCFASRSSKNHIYWWYASA